MGVYEKCPDCGGDIVVGMFSDIVVPKLGDDGEPDPSGERVTLRLPTHRNMEAISELRPSPSCPDCGGRVIRTLEQGSNLLKVRWAHAKGCPGRDSIPGPELEPRHIAEVQAKDGAAGYAE